MVLSTGASTMEEVGVALSAINEEYLKDVVLLHCVLNYPTAIEDSNLLMMNGLRKAFLTF